MSISSDPENKILQQKLIMEKLVASIAHGLSKPRSSDVFQERERRLSDVFQELSQKT